MKKSCSLFLLLVLVDRTRAMEIPLQEIAPVTQPLTPTKTPGDAQEAYVNLEILRKAIYKGSLSAVRRALKDVPDVNIADPKTLDTPLHFAFHHCKLNSAIIALLLSRGASQTARNCHNNTPLEAMMKRWQNSQLCEAIINNESPSHIAQLLTDGAHPSMLLDSTLEIPNKDLLYLTLSERNYPVATLLLNAGAIATRTYDNGNTALHLLYKTAKGEDLLEMSKLLIQKGASPDAKNDLGQTPTEQTKNTTIINRATDFLKFQICQSLDH